LDDWSYTQAAGGSPFLFDSPGSFDFFNPLFVFNFGGFTPQQLFGLVFAQIFGLPNSGATMVPVFIGPTGSTGMAVAPPSTTTSNSTTKLPNGTVVTTTTTTTTTRSLAPMQLGLAGFTHRHVFGPGTTVINIQVLITSPTTPNQ